MRTPIGKPSRDSSTTLANKQITVKAHTPGCYKYDAGAFFSGAIYGMSGGSKPELVILP